MFLTRRSLRTKNNVCPSVCDLESATEAYSGVLEILCWSCLTRVVQIGPSLVTSDLATVCLRVPRSAPGVGAVRHQTAAHAWAENLPVSWKWVHRKPYFTWERKLNFVLFSAPFLTVSREFNTGNYYKIIHRAIVGSAKIGAEKTLRFVCACRIALVRASWNRMTFWTCRILGANIGWFGWWFAESVEAKAAILALPFSWGSLEVIYLFDMLRPSNLVVLMYICTTRLNIQKFCVLPPQCICVFCVDLRTNSDYFTVQQ
jgi:hypothetical protein